jgi:hypothetical protein
VTGVGTVGGRAVTYTACSSASVRISSVVTRIVRRPSVGDQARRRLRAGNLGACEHPKVIVRITEAMARRSRVPPNVSNGSRTAVPSTVAHGRFTFNYGSTHPAEGRRDSLCRSNAIPQAQRFFSAGRVSPPLVRHEQRSRARGAAYMAIAPPSTWISEPVM